jgi:type I restriction enzyme S subunit
MSLVKIKDLFHFEKGTLQSTKATPGEFDFITAAADWKTHNEYTHDCEALIFAAAASGSLGRTHYVNGKFISSDLCFILTPKDEEKYPIDIQFYHLIFNAFKEEIVRNTKSGTSKEAIGLTVFGNYKLPYFEIEKQQNTKEAFLRTQELSQSLDNEFSNQLELIKNLRQAFLKEAMQGKLVEQDPNDEPASILIKKIKTEKERLYKEKKIKKPKSVNSLTNNELDIPDSWILCRLADIAEIGTGATPLTSNNEYYQNGTIPWITSSATNNLYVEEPEQYITEKALRETNCKVYPAGTLVVAMYGQGKTRGQITELTFDAATNQACATISLYLNEVYLKKFVKLFFQKIYLEIRELAQGGAQPNLNMGKISNTIIPLPPFSEQKRIVKKLDVLLNSCGNLEAAIKLNQQYNTKLLQQSLRDALGLKSAETQVQKAKELKKQLIDSRFDSTTLFMEIQELLKIHGKLQALDLWKMSKFYGKTDEERNIDGFYAELKKLIEKEKIVKETEKGYLELV